MVTMREGGRLVGLAPLCFDPAHRSRGGYRLLAGEMPRTTPLALPGRAWEVAGALAEVVGGARPAPRARSRSRASRRSSSWPLALAEQWPTRMRPWLRRYFTMSSPTVALAHELVRRLARRRRARTSADRCGACGDASRRGRRHEPLQHAGDAARRHRHARAPARRPLGGPRRVRRSSPAATRWRRRSRRSVALLLDEGGFRLHVLELDGEPISAQLFAAAGGDVIYFNGGWDERHAQLKPAMLGILARDRGRVRARRAAHGLRPRRAAVQAALRRRHRPSSRGGC